MHAFRIGRVFGIDIRVDSSWVFIFVLLTWNLASVFSTWHADWSVYQQIGVALVAALLFFGCLLLHELAHSLVAKRYGLGVRSITLFLFGGVSNLEHEPPSARSEFYMAIAGPIMSILLGFAFLVAAVLGTSVSLADPSASVAMFAQLSPVETLLVWLGPVNLVIGVFNLVPAFPLDGGRVLRSVLWAASGDLRGSTRRVSLVGQTFGWLFIVMGISMVFGMRVPFFGTGLIGGLWIAFIGWFLKGAAAQAYSRLAIDEALAGHVVSEAMRRNGPVVSRDLPVGTLVEFLVRSDERALPVTQGDHLLGLVSLSNVRAVPPADWLATTVGSVMQAAGGSLATTTPEQPLAKAFEQLARLDIDQLPVLDGGKLVGVLQRRDIARWLELSWGPVAGRRGPPAPPSLSSPEPRGLAHPANGHGGGPIV
jgi:Zn-dependent protease/CBS domain-containing protein